MSLNAKELAAKEAKIAARVCPDGHDYFPPVVIGSRTLFTRQEVAVCFCRRCGGTTWRTLSIVEGEGEAGP